MCVQLYYTYTPAVTDWGQYPRSRDQGQLNGFGAVKVAVAYRPKGECKAVCWVAVQELTFNYHKMGL